MRSSPGNWFSKLFNKASPQPPGQDPLAIPKTIPQQDIRPGAYYKKGDIIGQKYEVYGILGKGGFGVVYLVYSREYHTVYALKTFRDEFFLDKETRQRFRKEAQTWMNLERHPYLVRAVPNYRQKLYHFGGPRTFLQPLPLNCRAGSRNKDLTYILLTFDMALAII